VLIPPPHTYMPLHAVSFMQGHSDSKRATFNDQAAPHTSVQHHTQHTLAHTGTHWHTLQAQQPHPVPDNSSSTSASSSGASIHSRATHSGCCHLLAEASRVLLLAVVVLGPPPPPPPHTHTHKPQSAGLWPTAVPAEPWAADPYIMLQTTTTWALPDSHCTPGSADQG
jgi:hypothetical protein